MRVFTYSKHLSYPNVHSPKQARQLLTLGAELQFLSDVEI